VSSRYFVNARAFKMGSATALGLWRGALDDLKRAGFEIAKEIKPEYCVYDEKPELDYETSGA
jgi:hypothetical protein